MRRIAHSIVRRLSARHFATAKRYQQWQLRRSLATRAEEVLVYQMGKVGSSTIVTSLQTAKEDLLIHHVHKLGEEEIREFETFVRESFNRDRVKASTRAGLVSQLVEGDYLRRQLTDGRGNRTWKVVTLVRDPVARNLSAFFEVLEYWMDYDLQQNVRAKGADAVTLELCELFLERYPDHHLPLTFFESFRNTIGIDVFATPFPREKGYEIYRNGKVTVLLMRLEDLDRCGCEAVQQALGLERFALVGENLSSEKDYSEMYRRVRRAIRLPESYLEQMYGSKYANHFYSAEEIWRFRTKWTRGLVT